MQNSLVIRIKNILIGLMVTLMASTLIAGFAAGQSNKSADARRDTGPVGDQRAHDLTGAWSVKIFPSDGGPAFVGFYSFGADGNASFSSAGPPIPGLGNPGYGVWRRVIGNQFDSEIRMISYTQSFQFDGTLKIRARIQMTSPDTFVTTDAVTIYDVDGNEIVVLGGNAQGTRIVIDR